MTENQTQPSDEPVTSDKLEHLEQTLNRAHEAADKALSGQREPASAAERPEDSAD